ncbi:MAG: toll/interleukin-1 receptor domain-containing protein [Agriterribacter sp.]
MADQISFTSFLSHRYKSVEVNLYFFKVFSEVAEVQFEVDKGVFSTNVTKLERMVRAADAFIGIYPFAETKEPSAITEELKKQSRYFRLEIDLAIRSQKPAIVFYDKRYGNLIKLPPGVFAQSFDINEITGDGGFPSYEKHKRIFASFCESVSMKIKYEATQLSNEKNTAALFLSPGNSNKDFINDIETLLSTYNYSDLEVIEYPISLNGRFFSLLDKIDLAIVDYSEPIAASGIPAYLHGRFIPMIRIKQSTENGIEDSSALENFLFGGVEVGYKKDMIFWKDEDYFKKELLQKLQIIYESETKRIKTYKEAQDYFQSAVLRKEAVFVSYSGKDLDTAKPIIDALKKSYQTVFDYRDGKSIVPGQPWLAEIFEKLSASAIGVNLLSPSYIESGNCIHEAQQMIANVDNNKLKLFPVKLYEEPIQLPPFLQSIQYLRRGEYNTVDALVKQIVTLASGVS